MTMPKKSLRRVVVNGVPFHWKASFYDVGTYEGTRVRMICQAVEDPRSVMEATATDERMAVVFGPYAASQFITAALEKGWDPSGSKNFCLSSQKEPLDIPTKQGTRLMAHENGFYWVRLREGDDWRVAECKYAGQDFYFTDSEKKFSVSDFFEMDEHRIERIRNGMIVEMRETRGGLRFGAVIEADHSNKSFPYKVWYGPGPEQWVRLKAEEFSILEPRGVEG